MSLQTRITDFATAVGTDYKQLRVWLTGSGTGTLAGLTTTAKTDVVSAINEINAKPSGAGSVQATETTAGIGQIATTAEVTAGTVDTDIVTPLKLAQKLTAWAQPLSTNLTTLAGVVSGAFGRTLLTSADAAAAKSSLALVKGDVGLALVPNIDATARASHTGTQAATTITGLATVATSGSAADLTGVLGTAQLPPLAINDTFTVATQAAMLALTAQKGDVAVRSDLSRNYILAAEPAATLANWVQLAGGSDVLSVAGRTGAVVLAKADVGLANVDNTADTAKPVSTAQAAADDLRLLKTANLSDVAVPATALTNLGGASSASIGNPETDIVAVYTTAKA